MNLTQFQQVCDELCQYNGLPFIEVRLRPVKYAYAYLDTFRITLPSWITKTCKPYQMSFVIHEVCHFILGDVNHTDEFYELEQTLLAAYHMAAERRAGEAYTHKLFYKGRLVKVIP